jgi:glutamate:GABA antiporter
MNDKKIGILSLALMGIMSVYSLIDIPIMAQYGVAAIFYYTIAALFFFIPCALVCAELASGWPKAGGIYAWTKEAFGEKVGFLTVWLEWINNVIVFPASLSFTASIIAYFLPAHMQLHKYQILLVIVIIFWGVTFINFRGIKYSSKLSNFGFTCGTILPSLLIIGLGVTWYFNHGITNVELLTKSAFNLSAFKSAFLVSLIMGYCGIQVIAFHAQDVQNPERNFPKAILIVTVVTLLLYILSAMAIFVVIPVEHLNLISGLVQALQEFFQYFNLTGLLAPIIFLIILSRISSLSMWVIGPARGLSVALRDSEYTKNINLFNKHGSPTVVLIIQAIITTCLAMLYLFIPSVVDVYWVFLALSTALTLMMYILMFAAAIKLRHTQPEVIRTYKIPGGNIGLWLIAGCGLLVSSYALILSFIPPGKLFNTASIFYKELGFMGLFALVTLSIIMLLSKKVKRLTISSSMEI